MKVFRKNFDQIIQIYRKQIDLCQILDKITLQFDQEYIFIRYIFKSNVFKRNFDFIKIVPTGAI